MTKLVPSPQKNNHVDYYFLLLKKNYIRHFFTTFAFTHEKYDLIQIFSVKKIPLADGSFEFPGCKNGILLMNLYGSKPACNICLSGLHTHLKTANYT